jgi:glycine/D-amino acid oxidase-like deaminating enzyme
MIDHAPFPTTTPYWLDYAYEPRPPLHGELTADACVIGGGVSGLSAAREFTNRGLDTVLLEAETVARGASGRNGGFLLAGPALFYPDACARYGHAAAKKLYARTLETQAEIYALAAELGAGDAVRPVGCLRVAISPDEVAHVRAHVEMLQADGFPAELIPKPELPEVLRGIGHAACFTDHDGALQPARWIRALARAAERSGVRIFEGSRVATPVPAPAAGPVRTPDGAVHAPIVVVAADGPLPRLLPHYAGLARPRRLHMTATAPIAERLLENVVYARWGYEYFQQRPDGRITLGGFSDLDGEDSYTEREEGSQEVWAALLRFLREDLGLEAEVTHRWVGVVSYADDDRLRVGAVPESDGLFAAGVYGGVGNLIGFLAGRAVAELAATGESEDIELLIPER